MRLRMLGFPFYGFGNYDDKGISDIRVSTYVRNASIDLIMYIRSN